MLNALRTLFIVITICGSQTVIAQVPISIKIFSENPQVFTNKPVNLRKAYIVKEDKTNSISQMYRASGYDQANNTNPQMKCIPPAGYQEVSLGFENNRIINQCFYANNRLYNQIFAEVSVSSGVAFDVVVQGNLQNGFKMLSYTIHETQRVEATPNVATARQIPTNRSSLNQRDPASNSNMRKQPQRPKRPL